MTDEEVKQIRKKLSTGQNNLIDALMQTYKNDKNLSPEEKKARSAELKKIFLEQAPMLRQDELRDKFITKALAKSKYFNDYEKLDAVKNVDYPIDPKYFQLVSDKDLKEKNVEGLQNVNENIFNWESPEHWSKAHPEEIKKYARTMGMSVEELMKDISKAQTKMDREDLFAFSKDPLAWFSSILYPRTAEAVMRGEDPTAKDLILDTGENALYAFNPFGKGLSVGARVYANADKQGVAKALKLLGSGLDIGGNPLVMEGLDALAYSDEDNTDRNKFSGMDVLYGTGMNALLGKAAPKATQGMVKKIEKSYKPVPQQVEKVIEQPKTEIGKIARDNWRKTNKDRYAAEEILKQRELQGKSNKELEEIIKKNKEWKSLEYEAEKGNKPKINPKLDKEVLMTAGEIADETFTPNRMWFVDFGSNKAGDLLGENPRMRNRAIRTLPGGRFVYPYLQELSETEEQKKNKETRQQVYDLLGR